jgi:hypothetical protein
MNPDNEQLAQLISGVSESLHREISGVSESLRREMHEGFTRVNERLDLMETRLGRHAALIQTGARWSARMTEWSEKVDRHQSDRDKKIADLEKRVRDLERKRNGQK